MRYVGPVPALAHGNRDREAGAGAGADGGHDPRGRGRHDRHPRAAGAAPAHRGDPGYASRLDRDGDATGCDRD
ncbi:excalibur calcium-binding domain-containing protein [Streptomyces sp. MMCC 100]|uniref:excalibur calcium-binding domain-containing protein n=1 Tax=Streptomyces sp. MMCC 100 TaxID=3163555 RepID=UPI00359AFC34